MTTPHKHAALIKAWADGAQIETFSSGAWRVIGDPCWDPATSYRIEVKPHKWQHLIDAQAAGKVIEARLPGKEWEVSSVERGWRFDDVDMEYRIKPETIRYRVALVKRLNHEPYTMTVEDEFGGDELVASYGSAFVRWITGWVEVEL